MGEADSQEGIANVKTLVGVKAVMERLLADLNSQMTREVGSGEEAQDIGGQVPTAGVGDGDADADPHSLVGGSGEPDLPSPALDRLSQRSRSPQMEIVSDAPPKKARRRNGFRFTYSKKKKKPEGRATICDQGGSDQAEEVRNQSHDGVPMDPHANAVETLNLGKALGLQANGNEEELIQALVTWDAEDMEAWE